MNTIDTLNLALAQIQTLQTQSAAGSTASATGGFATTLETAIQNIQHAITDISGPSSTTTTASTTAAASSATSGYEAFKADAKNNMLVAQLGNRGPGFEEGLWNIYANMYDVTEEENPFSAAAQVEVAAYNSRYIVPQKGTNGYYNQDVKPADPVASADIYSPGAETRKAAYEQQQLALAVWQQKEVALSNLAMRQSGVYGEGSPLPPVTGKGDWQTEFNQRIQAMREQGLAVDSVLGTVSMT